MKWVGMIASIYIGVDCLHRSLGLPPPQPFIPQPYAFWVDGFFALLWLWIAVDFARQKPAE